MIQLASYTPSVAILVLIMLLNFERYLIFNTGYVIFPWFSILINTVSLVSDFALDAMGTLVAFLSIMLTLVSRQGVTCHGEHPLSKIAIHKTVLSLDIHASIKATPSVLGVNVSSHSFSYSWISCGLQ